MVTFRKESALFDPDGKLTSDSQYGRAAQWSGWNERVENIEGVSMRWLAPALSACWLVWLSWWLPRIREEVVIQGAKSPDEGEDVSKQGGIVSSSEREVLCGRTSCNVAGFVVKAVAP